MCSYTTNKCFYSCQQSAADREDEFKRLMNDERLASCPISSSKSLQINEQVNTTTSSTMLMNQAKATSKYEEEFLSARMWLITVVLLSVALTFAVISGLLAIGNIWINPVNSLFGVFGLFLLNGIAAALCGLTIVVWGSLYIFFISENIAITDTLTSIGHYSSLELADLGFSFWILFASIACHLINIRILYYRKYLIQREPPAPVITVQKNDATVLVY